jgi:hypothetical protein
VNIVITNRTILPRNIDAPKSNSDIEYKNIFDMLNCDNKFAGLMEYVTA